MSWFFFFFVFFSFTDYTYNIRYRSFVYARSRLAKPSRDSHGAASSAQISFLFRPIATGRVVAERGEEAGPFDEFKIRNPLVGGGLDGASAKEVENRRSCVPN